MSHIGILGGTFNPVHLGHTLPAKNVAEHLSLDKVLFIPANVPPHKSSPNVCANHRATMVKLACEHEPKFNCDERELTREGYSYTVETLQELSKNHPDTNLYFIMGLDSLLTFTTWHKYQNILTYCHLVVNTRPNYQLKNLNQATKSLLNKHQISDINVLKNMSSGGVLLLSHSLPSFDNQLDLNISSSEIRNRLNNNQTCQDLLSPKVLAFINKNKLYR